MFCAHVELFAADGLLLTLHCSDALYRYCGTNRVQHQAAMHVLLHCLFTVMNTAPYVLARLQWSCNKELHI